MSALHDPVSLPDTRNRKRAHQAVKEISECIDRVSGEDLQTLTSILDTIALDVRVATSANPSPLAPEDAS